MKRKLLVLISLSGLLAACSNGPESTPESAGPAVKAEIAAVAMTPVPERASLPGTVRGANTAVLAARAGGRVTRVAVEAGDQVKANQLLVEVDPADARAALAQAQARLAQANAQWQQAQADEKRYSALLKQGAVTEREYEQVKHRYDAARAAHGAARQGVDAARQRLGYAVVRAPFAGVVADRRIDPGDMVPPGTPLMTVAGGHPEVRVYAGEKVFSRLGANTPATVTVDGRTLPARIIQRVQAADPQTHTHLVKLALEADAPAAVGAYATATFTLDSRKALSVPANAVITRAGITGAFVVDDSGLAHFREVRTGDSANGRTVIAAGLAEGERVVAAPTPAVGNGTRIIGEGADE
ncbi:MAG: efflux RND transporter periplasmic adaptor subunit [Gammaproteobacteria bacterium]